MWASLKIDFGGGQPMDTEVHFGLTGNQDDSSAPQVGLKAVKTMAGDILSTITEPQQEMVKQAVLNHLSQIEDNLP